MTILSSLQNQCQSILTGSEVIEAISSADLTLNRSKWKFGSKEIKYCGMIDSSEGMKPDPAKVDSPKYITAPTNKNELITSYVWYNQTQILLKKILFQKLFFYYIKGSFSQRTNTPEGTFQMVGRTLDLFWRLNSELPKKYFTNILWYKKEDVSCHRCSHFMSRSCTCSRTKRC